MSGIKPRVQNCFDTYRVPGTAFVNVTIAADGTVAFADVGGSLVSTPEAECIGRAVRLAAFPIGRQKCAFVYPYILR
jgi:hypothetical protein